MIYYSKGGEEYEFTSDEINAAVVSFLEKYSPKKVLAIPPDFTRFHSYAGKITEFAWRHLREKLTDVLPALGTHFAMTENEIDKMFGAVPPELFRVHKWREDIKTLGVVPKEYIYEITEGKVRFDWPAQVNKLLVEGGHDLILSIGQVVPHEVMGMANYNKNIFVGTGGAEGINKSHFVGAAYGMERIMGKAHNPVRQILNYASDNFTGNLPIVYILTVIRKNRKGELVVCGLFIGDEYEMFLRAAELSLKVNFEMLDKPLKKIVVYLDPAEFKSTWLGNKAVYRTRMAIADGGELIIIAPGLREFGEDKTIDGLIRKYGYRTTPEILKFVEENEDLRNNLGAAAHLIHGSPENRFKITYAAGVLTEKEIRSVNFNYADLNETTKIYNPKILKDGFNVTPEGGEVFYISNPALGLWAYKERFNKIK